ncbi:PSD1 and planctomycete cytochrome C domain-containing protein [Pirellulaceae bacterium SH467]
MRQPFVSFQRAAVALARPSLATLSIAFLASVGLVSLSDTAKGQTTEAPSAASMESLSSEAISFFESKIRPVLIEHCFRCHSSDGQAIRGGLSLDHRDAILVGGESGPAIVPHNLDESVLWDAINHRGMRMPPNAKLPANVIDDFKTWIEMGAPDPRIQTGTTVQSQVTAEDIEKGRSFWSFQKPTKPPVPTPTLPEWPRTDIDRFVAATWDKQNLKPAMDTAASNLVRRLHIDLIGILPDASAVQAFEKAYEKSPEDAVSKTVDELLAQPQFGERWGRHWLDVARYAESTGKEVDATFPYAWRYRDFVIDSFQQDKPYDLFVRQQVAGDLLPAPTDEVWAENLIATGFLAIGPKSLSEQNPRQFKADLVDEQIDATTRVILGVSVACARCHDHKFDPITQEDYYALAGLFQSTETCYGGSRSLRNRQPSRLIELPIDDLGPDAKPLAPSDLAKMKDQRSRLETELIEARRAQRQPNASNNPRNRFLNAAVLDQAVSQLNQQILSYDSSGRPLTLAMGVQDSERITNARLLARGEIDKPAQEVPRGFVTVLSSQPVSLSANTSGRLEFAQWLTSCDNPLTARVMVNRIWQHLIGKALVRETDNFGLSGPAPSHPELLDYLAVEFMDHNWSVKHVIRTIANSRVYRLSSQYDPSHLEADPNNLYVARANPRRLDAEALRDSILAISHQLDPRRPRGSIIAAWGQTILGPNGPAAIPPEALRAILSDSPETVGTLLRPLIGIRNNSQPFDAPTYYRSVYLPIARNNLPRALDLFDFAEPSLIVGERESSNTPEQALYLMNSPFILEQSDALARVLIQSQSNPIARIEQAFVEVYGRKATEEERNAALAFYRSAVQGKQDQPSDVRSFGALSQLCQALFGSAEFRYIP